MTHSEDGRECIARAFITGESGNGEYRVVMKFETLADMQSAHNYLVRAQPARQVGGDALSMADYLRMANEAFGRVVDRDLIGNPITDYDVLLRGAYGPAVRRLVELAVSRAALAPAAVVMPDRKPIEPLDFNRTTSDVLAEGWNAALDEVASLNRRAIPVELLERACKDYTGRAHLDALEPDRLAAAAELRALLGKGA